MYDLRTDPYQLQNIYATADPAHIADLSQRLAELASSQSNPPTIESIMVNDGLAQRSMVKSLTVTFDRVAAFDPGAFVLQRQDGTAVDLNVATSVVGGRTVAVLTFSGTGIIGGSLADGNYTPTIRGNHIRDEVGREVDGDGDGNGGGTYSEAFHRLYGDSDGDRDVDLHDLGQFLSAFGDRAGESDYWWYFDVNGDDRVGVVDLVAFAKRLGTSLNP
jgi:hypothetical protein